MSSANLEVTQLTADSAAAHLTGLTELLHACVLGGASVSFVLPYSSDDAQVFWQAKVLPAVAGGKLALWVARQDGRIAGSVQLDIDTPPNQPHRAEVRKLLVHPDFRRRGIARLLLREAEAYAQQCGRTLITLDTRSGDSAEPLYTSMGYVTVGQIPGFSRDPHDPSKVDGTTIMYKQMRSANV
ncbi:GNAT family N-acetyltransferase [Achromobacter seleniivolatilans]|uniref:GNAT family N-acetyltransferase n=1 Tax=Achromobacter seleniivolatilans TaxID=3047478 RepID=A0ABY9M077_9BURK|nr:GNAT family N-acetyltransferase [Achromobacter sp. R39]WMD20392.1 GNAT family N-acetyltransferase [Achromobacter sp. R39]